MKKSEPRERKPEAQSVKTCMYGLPVMDTPHIHSPVFIKKSCVNTQQHQKKEDRTTHGCSQNSDPENPCDTGELGVRV